MARVFITGGAGFIGSHTARRILDGGHEVFVYDSFHQYAYPLRPSFLENMQYRSDVLLKGANVVRGSTSNRDTLRRYLSEIRPTHIIHLAALPLANLAIRQSEEAFEGIVEGTVNVLEILRDVNWVERFVYVSSSMVYGDFRQFPMPEDGAKEPKEIYGGMKLAGEILVKVFSQRYGIPYAIVRPSAVYGPTDNNSRVLQLFVEGAVAGRPITAVNPATTTLDFTYVADIAAGLGLAALNQNASNTIFNMTCGDGRTLQEAISVLRGLFPDLAVTVREEGDGYRPNRGTLDISKARSVLGYQPQFPLEAGLRAYVDHLKQFNPSICRRG